MKGILLRVSEFATEEALSEQDGRVVPLTKEPGGPVIGEATLSYEPEEKVLMAEFQVDDPEIAKIIQDGLLPPIVELGE